MSDQPVPLSGVCGTPVEITSTVTGGAAFWPSDNRQVYGAVRVTPTSAVIVDLSPYLSAATVGADVKVTLSLPGSVTRLFTIRSKYDVRIAELGANEADALRVMHGPVIFERAYVAAPS